MNDMDNAPSSTVATMDQAPDLNKLFEQQVGELGVSYYFKSRFYDKTGCPLVVNTSFNVRGEPIVCTPTDAFKCFLVKEEQDEMLKENYEKRYELD
jgi:hypothetical protein